MYTVTKPLNSAWAGLRALESTGIPLPVGSDSQARRGYAISGTFQGDSGSGSCQQWLSVHDPTDTPGPGPKLGCHRAPSGACQVLSLTVSISGLSFSGPGAASSGLWPASGPSGPAGRLGPGRTRPAFNL